MGSSNIFIILECRRRVDFGRVLRLREMREKDKCVENFSYRINDFGKLTFMVYIAGITLYT